MTRVPQVGDEVIVSCESAIARVAAVDSRHISVEWPWGAADHSGNIRWSGRFSIPCDATHPEWVPYRLEPDISQLHAGDVCAVSIPPTRLYVGHYEAYDPPRNLGWLPAPTAGIYVVPPENKDMEDAGCMLYLGGAEPIRVEAAKD